MPEHPQATRPPEFVRAEIILFFEQHKKQYRLIWENLDHVRHTYQEAPEHEKRAILKAAYINSVISVNTQLSSHERAYTEWVENGLGLRDALREGGAGLYMKVDGVHNILDDESFWDRLVSLLDDGKVDTADMLLRDEAPWVKTVKAPFTLANIGFVQKMCVDTNVSRLFQLEDLDMSVGPYEKLCTDIRSMFPELSGRMRPYELQWLLFDFQRLHIVDEDAVRRGEGEIAKHEIWFNTFKENYRKVISAAERETMLAMGMDPDGPDADDVADEIEEAIYESLGREAFNEAFRDVTHEEISAAVAKEINGD